MRDADMRRIIEDVVGHGDIFRRTNQGVSLSRTDTELQRERFFDAIYNADPISVYAALVHGMKAIGEGNPDLVTLAEDRTYREQPHHEPPKRRFGIFPTPEEPDSFRRTEAPLVEDESDTDYASVPIQMTVVQFPGFDLSCLNYGPWRDVVRNVCRRYGIGVGSLQGDFMSSETHTSSRRGWLTGSMQNAVLAEVDRLHHVKGPLVFKARVFQDEHGTRSFEKAIKGVYEAGTRVEGAYKAEVERLTALVD